MRDSERRRYDDEEVEIRKPKASRVWTIQTNDANKKLPTDTPWRDRCTINGLTPKDARRLLAWLKQVTQKGIKVIITNGSEVFA